MRSAIVLVAVLATCACAQGVTKGPSEETQATPAAAAPQATGSSAAAGSPQAGSGAAPQVDPRSPNWQVTSIKLSDNRWRLELRMRPWHTGGDGEAEVLLHNQARELAAQEGYRHYVVLSFVQGIESSAPIAQRWARAEIELQEALPPMPLEKP